MPELPEVETVRRELAATLVGRTVTEVAVHGPRTVRRQSVRRFRAGLTGRRVLDVRRHGKYLLIGCDGGTLVVHLRMTGRLSLEDGAPGGVIPHTHAVLSLDDGRRLRFVDPRTFGELFFATEGDQLLADTVGRLGPDAADGGIGPEALGRLVGRRRTSLKAFLLDQSMIAGIGNIYADEICFAAGLRPDRSTATLGADDLARLAVAVRAVLSRAVGSRGTSLGDGGYRDLFGDPGGFQAEHAVYGRGGKPCPRCGTAIEKSRLVGRSTHWCPRCQG